LGFSKTDNQHPSPNTQHPTTNTQQPTPVTQHPTPNTPHPTPHNQNPPKSLSFFILAEDPKKLILQIFFIMEQIKQNYEQLFNRFSDLAEEYAQKKHPSFYYSIGMVCRMDVTHLFRYFLFGIHCCFWHFSRTISVCWIGGLAQQNPEKEKRFRNQTRYQSV
jgi:hypothetical protein